MSDLREAFAKVLREHQFVPGIYPDPDYCSCGTRYGLYTKGDGLYPCHFNMHLPDKIAEAAALASRPSGEGPACGQIFEDQFGGLARCTLPVGHKLAHVGTTPIDAPADTLGPPNWSERAQPGPKETSVGDLKAKLESLRELSEKAMPGTWVAHEAGLITKREDVNFIVACVNAVRAIIEGKD